MGIGQTDPLPPTSYGAGVVTSGTPNDNSEYTVHETGKNALEGDIEILS